MKFDQQKLADIWGELTPLLQSHWKEIAHYQDIPLDVDVDRYNAIEESGSLKLFTVRSDSGQLIGYAAYFLNYNLHYKTSLQAIQDVIYIDPSHRGIGREFIMACDRALQKLGVQAVYHHVKSKHNFGPMLERLGYEEIDRIFAKRLDGPERV